MGGQGLREYPQCKHMALCQSTQSTHSTTASGGSTILRYSVDYDLPTTLEHPVDWVELLSTLNDDDHVQYMGCIAILAIYWSLGNIIQYG